MDQFWLRDEQFARFTPHLPTDIRGKERVDDRRVISGIIHVLKSGGCWTDARARSTGRRRRSTTASCAGRLRESGSACSRRWRKPAACPPRC